MNVESGLLHQDRHGSSAVLTEDAGNPEAGGYAPTWAAVRRGTPEGSVRRAGGGVGRAGRRGRYHDRELDGRAGPARR
ncbi:hypothetical protein [Streptomyces sp. NPDC127072]|uniref:hypothetical protein n=1 Tax=Streptomyces sp. NPDC127072 TaxID=3347129 RepID=UPI003666F5A1